MAKLTKVQRNTLELVTSDLKRALAFIREKDISICQRGPNASTTLHFTRKPVNPILLNAEQVALGDYSLFELDKEIGSNLTGLEMGLVKLLRFLEFDANKNA